jgi:uncharacterized membrane protein YfcA
MIFGFIGSDPAYFNVSASFATQKVARSRPPANKRESWPSADRRLESGRQLCDNGVTESSPALPELTLYLLLLLLAASFVAGFIDSIAGGGGLITVPTLLIAGFSPIQVLGTNKLQSLFGSGSATLAYARGGHVPIRAQLPTAAMSALGSAIGAVATTYIPGAVLQALMPVLLVVIAVYFLLKPNISEIDRHRRMPPFVFGLTLVPLIGFYDGVFGPGTGSFFMLAFVSLLGFGMLKATAHTKLLNFASNIGAFCVFAFSGVILWKAGLVMGVGQFLGAQAGSRLAMKNGARIIRPLLVVTCVALTIKLLADPANPLRIWLGF